MPCGSLSTCCLHLAQMMTFLLQDTVGATPQHGVHSNNIIPKKTEVSFSFHTKLVWKEDKLSNRVCVCSFFSRAKDVIIPAKPPVSFFSSRSPVLDLFQGQLDYAEHVRRDSEVVLLFFYAPWCGQSIAARAEIEQAARQLSDQVMPTFSWWVKWLSSMGRAACPYPGTIPWWLMWPGQGPGDWLGKL